MADKPSVPDFRAYHLVGKPGSRRIIHTSSGLEFGHEEGLNNWVNKDDEDAILHADTPEDLLRQNKEAGKAYDTKHGFRDSSKTRRKRK